ncbi:MAG: DNA polymerase IV [Actinobacteria bacterium]|nr:DNA polymerase IV [Actinomycetota bacterium]
MFVTAAATILHADLDSFYASVEQRDDPALRGRPVLVTGGGVVLAASYEAKAKGVSTPMGLAPARRLCPEAAIARPRMTAYSQASKEVFAIFRETSPTVEALSIDEAFLDVGGMEHFAGTPYDIAKRLREQVRERAGLPITVGVARTKFLAKVASGVAKPDGLLVVDPAHELEFLHPLKVERLWGVGKVTSKKLHESGLFTVGDVARRGEDELIALLGHSTGRHLHALVHNRDPRPVRVRPRRRSIGAQRALGRGPRSAEQLDTILISLIDRVAPRLRRADRAARTVVLHLRFGDFNRVTRSHTLPRATRRSDVLIAAARDLLAASLPAIERDGITLIGVSLANLDDEVQLELPLDEERPDTLDDTVDAVRDRYGKTAITRAVLLGRDQGIAAPQLPD